MALIECRSLRKDWAGVTVLDSVDLAVQPGEKLGLVGRNGAGKTTLLDILAGLDDDWKGGLVRDPGLRVGYLSQHVEPPGKETALEFLMEDALAAERGLRAAEEAMADADARDAPALMAAYERAYDAFEAKGGAEAEDRARRALALVGLSGREDVRASALSGGERGILALAKALQGSPSLVILDEPGNHLDFWGLAWLEDFLAGYPAACLIVSHNRMLLDRTVTRIIELERGKASSHSGDYSAYRLDKLRNAAAQGADWQASRKRIERLEEMVRVAAVRAAAFTKHQAKSNGSLGQKLRARRRQLERAREQATERPELGASSISASFSGRGAADVKSDYALIVRDYHKAFGERTLFSKAGFDVLRGERVALVGPNGCGKTTLLRDIVDHGDWNSDSLRLCPSMRLGYVAQDRDGFARGQSVRDEFGSLGAKEGEIRALLRDFGFGSGDPDRLIDTLSGGELNRLQLARAVYSGANFLILDEPTNHLDIDARESVEDKLAEYDGTMLVVSHDRYFLEKVAERVVYVKDGRFEVFEGSFSEFWLEEGASHAPGRNRRGSGENAILGRGKAIARAKASARTADAGIEERIVGLENDKTLLERRIKAAFDARDFKLARALSNELEDLREGIERLYELWA